MGIKTRPHRVSPGAGGEEQGEDRWIGSLEADEWVRSMRQGVSRRCRLGWGQFEESSRQAMT